jgi:hypothetical protein
LKKTKENETREEIQSLRQDFLSQEINAFKHGFLIDSEKKNQNYSSQGKSIAPVCGTTLNKSKE